MMPSSTTLLWRACTQVVLRGGVDSTNRIVTGSTGSPPTWQVGKHAAAPNQCTGTCMSWINLPISWDFDQNTQRERCLPFGRTTMVPPCFPNCILTGLLRTSWLEVGVSEGSVPVISCHGFGEFQATTSIQQRERQKVGLRFASCETAPLLRYTSFQWKRLKLRFAWWKLCLQAPHASVQRTWWGSDFFPRLGCCSIKDVSSVTPPFCWFYAQWILMGYDFPFDAIPWNLKPVVFFTLQADLVRKICDNLACKPLEASWPDHRW